MGWFRKNVQITHVLHCCIAGFPLVYMVIAIPCGFLVNTDDLEDGTHYIYSTDNSNKMWAYFSKLQHNNFTQVCVNPSHWVEFKKIFLFCCSCWPSYQKSFILAYIIPVLIIFAVSIRKVSFGMAVWSSFWNAAALHFRRPLPFLLVSSGKLKRKWKKIRSSSKCFGKTFGSTYIHS